MKIKLKGGSQDLELTLEEARRLGEELAQLLGEGRVVPPIQVQPVYIGTPMPFPYADMGALAP